MRRLRFIAGGVGVVGVVASIGMLALTGSAAFFVTMVASGIVVQLVAPNRKR